MDAILCGGCYRTGVDSVSQPLDKIGGVGVDSLARGLCSIFPTSSVSIGVPLGSPMAGGHGQRTLETTRAHWYVDDPNYAAQIISKARESAAHKAGVCEAKMRAQAMAGMMMAPGALCGADPATSCLPLPVGIGQWPADIPDQLLKLRGMMDQGVITEADYEAKKTEMLDRM